MYTSLQQLFDVCANYLITMPHRAHTNYRCPNGDKCVIGNLIPDNLYDPRIERLSVTAAPVFARIRPQLDLSPKKIEDARHMLERFQKMHDDPDNWNKRRGFARRRIGDLATAMGLSYQHA